MLANGNFQLLECLAMTSSYFTISGHKAVNKGAVKTGPGRLSCKCIIHVVTPHSGEHLKSAVLKALELADNDGMRSIAFPALGTGIRSSFKDQKLTGYGLFSLRFIWSAMFGLTFNLVTPVGLP